MTASQSDVVRKLRTETHPSQPTQLTILPSLLSDFLSTPGATILCAQQAMPQCPLWGLHLVKAKQQVFTFPRHLSSRVLLDTALEVDAHNVSPPRTKVRPLL